MLHSSFIPTSVACDTSGGGQGVKVGFMTDVVVIELLVSRFTDNCRDQAGGRAQCVDADQQSRSDQPGMRAEHAVL